ncbi:MAG: nucleotide exchange factor GrpE [Lachnospiraceae bacterium]|nr:nucleotide exchange factor GrpE [Lachnospiraceae bacterium]
MTEEEKKLSEEAAEAAAAEQEAEAVEEETVEESAEQNEETSVDDTETEEASADEEESEEDGSGINLFGRKEKKELKKKEEELAHLKDQHLRLMAEYDNFRKRTEKEKADIYTYAVKDALTKILPVLDNFERGLAQIPEDQKDDPYAQGMDMIYKQFVKALTDIGVEPIETAEKPFDPNLHNAVMHVEDEDFGDGIIVEEFQKGYTYRGAVIRHSMVKVAN